jgi:hypothetical protein
MERITNDNDGGRILNIELHQHLYKLMPDGDMYMVRRGELSTGWIAMPEDSTRRRHIFGRFRRVGITAPWRYENGIDPTLKGFTRVLRDVHGQLHACWACDGCNGVYEDTPVELDYLWMHGCRNAACVRYIERNPLIAQYDICSHCGWKYHDPNGDVVTCPQCEGDLSKHDVDHHQTRNVGG